MAEQLVWFGTNGPYFYDDAVPYSEDPFDPDNLIDRRAMRTTGQLRVETAPVDDNEVSRLGDLTEAIEALRDDIEGLLDTLRGDLETLIDQAAPSGIAVLWTGGAVPTGWSASAIPAYGGFNWITKD